MPTASRRSLVLLGAVLLALNALLLLPGFLFRHDHVDWTPFFPREHPRGPFGFDLRSVIEYPLALLLRRPNGDVFRVVSEWVALCSLTMLAANTRVAKPVRIVGAAGYVLLLLFLVYEHAFLWFFKRVPVLSEDRALAISLWHFLVEMRGTRSTFFALLAVVACGALTWSVALVLGKLQKLAPRSWKIASVILLVWSVVSLAWFGVSRDDAVVQLASKRVASNYARSRLTLEKNEAARNATPDRRYDDFSRITLGRKPDVSMLIIEAYGEVLATWDMTTAYRALMKRVQERLSKRGLLAATFTSAAPVHGGMSWFSLTTMQTGILIDRPEVFAQASKGQLPTLTGFLKQQGYFTVAMQPGTSNKAGVGPRDFLNHDRFIGAEELAYSGRAWGFGRIPDQFSWRQLANERAHLTSPRMLSTFCVSTHFPWGELVPPYFAPENIDTGAGEDRLHDETWPALPGVDEMGEYRRSYFKSVEYEFRLFTEFVESDPSRDLLVIIVGDHQPRLESNPPGEVTLNTPLHVLTTDAALHARFLEAGAVDGMMLEPGRPTLNHEGLFSLLVWALAQTYGDDVSKVVGRRSPDGAGLSAIYR